MEGSSSISSFGWLHQRAAHGQHLLLAAGKGPGDLVAALPQPGEAVERVLQICPGEFLADISAHFQILLHRHLQEDPAALRHMGQALGQELIGLDVGNILVAEGDFAAPGMQDAGEGLQCR